MLNHRVQIVVGGALVMVGAYGCGEKSQPPAAPPLGAPAARPAVEAPATPPAGVPAAPSTGAPSTAPASAASAGGAQLTVAGVSLPIPDGWKQTPPSNPMRLAEIQVPGASGNPADACVIAISTAGGDVQSNISRWAGQVKDASGQPVTPAVQTRTVNGLKVHIAEMTGTYVGMNEAARQGWTLRGAIVETPTGLLFIKMTGPAETMAAASAGFSAMIDRLRAR